MALSTLTPLVTGRVPRRLAVAALLALGLSGCRASPVTAPTGHNASRGTTAAASAAPSPALASGASPATTTPITARSAPAQATATSHLSAASTSPSGPHGDPYCRPADFRLTATTDHADGTYSARQTVTFTLTATYEGTARCDFPGAYQPDETIDDSMQHPVYVWTCTDSECGHFIGKDPLQAGDVAFTTTSTWHEDECTTGSCSTCEPQCAPNPPAPPGTYSAVFTSQQVGTSNTVAVRISA